MKVNLRHVAARVQAAVFQARISGFVDTVNGHSIAGWAIDQGKAAEEVYVEINGIIAGQAITGLFREDLRVAGKADGCCAFCFIFPDSLDSKTEHYVRILVGPKRRPLALSSNTRLKRFRINRAGHGESAVPTQFDRVPSEHQLELVIMGQAQPVIIAPPLDYLPAELTVVPPEAASPELIAEDNIAAAPEPEAETAPAYSPAFSIYYSCYGAQLSIGNDYYLLSVDRHALPIMQQPIAVEFIGPATQITAIGLHFATYMRQNSCSIMVELHEVTERTGQSTKIGEYEIVASSVIDNALRLIDFSRLKLTPGKRYRMLLHAPAATAGNHFAAWSIGPEHAKQYSRHFLGSGGAGKFLPRPAAHAAPRQKPSIAVIFCPNRIEMPEVCAYLEQTLPNTDLDVMVLESAFGQYLEIARHDMVIFANFRTMPEHSRAGFDHLAFALHKAGVVTISLETASSLAGSNNKLLRLGRNIQHAESLRRQLRRRCHLMALVDYTGKTKMQSSVLGNLEQSDFSPALLEQLINACRTGQKASVEIVTVLYRKAAVVGDFLRMVGQQSYGGPIKVTFVDDCSPDDAVEVVLNLSRSPEIGLPENVSVEVMRNSENIGNCGSRNRGVAASNADIIIVMDCDCLINRDFIAAHVFEHWFPDIDVVIGPLNIETNGRNGIDLVRHLEEDSALLANESGLQDDITPNGFLNCITRNFSIKRQFLQGQPLFDEDFAYSNKPNTGFGWEDVEMGYRLYRSGARIAYTSDAFSVHVSHASSVSEQRKVLGSMRNFNLMFSKHEELEFASRRWATETVQRIFQWADGAGVERNDDRAMLERRFGMAAQEIGPFIRAWKSNGRRLRILTYRWHVAHQYELYKLPHDFTLVTGIGNEMCETWDYDSRPLRPNARFRHIGEIDPSQYDLAIVHFDENILASHLCNNMIPPDWGSPAKYFLANFKMPMIGLCHGTPQFVGQYGLTQDFIENFEIYEAERQQLVNAFSHMTVVCNSYQAQQEWQFRNSRVIWHGFDPQEFPPTQYPGGILTIGGPATERPHYRGSHHLQRIRDLLPPDIRLGTVSHEDAGIRPRATNRYAAAKFRTYVDRMRDYSIYLNPTIRSPMPRSRGEAMMCGLVPVSIRNHDVDHFVRNGVNGFYADSADELAEYLVYLEKHPDMTRKMGMQARLTAMDVFNNDRYLAEWTRLLSDVIS